MNPPAFAVAGWKNAGKTTLVERLVAHLTGRGFRVGTLKRSHDAFLMDVEGTDTARHRLAGAATVAMVGPNGWTVARTGPEPAVEDVIASMTSCDLVVVEGYKNGTLPLVEVVADPAVAAIRDTNPNVFAVASDLELEANVPVLLRNAVPELAALALSRIGLA